MREIVSVGLDGRSNSIWIYYDELKLSSYMRNTPTMAEILEQHSTAMYYDRTFNRVPLADSVKG